jgi:hypothetical protein
MDTTSTTTGTPTPATATVCARYVAIAAQVAETNPNSGHLGIRLIPHDEGAYIIGINDTAAIVMNNRGGIVSEAMTINPSGEFLAALRKEKNGRPVHIQGNHALLERGSEMLAQEWATIPEQEYPDVVGMIQAMASGCTLATVIPSAFMKSMAPAKNAGMLLYNTKPDSAIILRCVEEPDYLGVMMPLSIKGVEADFESSLPEWAHPVEPEPAVVLLPALPASADQWEAETPAPAKSEPEATAENAAPTQRITRPRVSHVRRHPRSTKTYRRRPVISKRPAPAPVETPAPAQNEPPALEKTRAEILSERARKAVATRRARAEERARRAA